MVSLFGFRNSSKDRFQFTFLINNLDNVKNRDNVSYSVEFHRGSKKGRIPFVDKVEGNSVVTFPKDNAFLTFETSLKSQTKGYKPKTVRLSILEQENNKVKEVVKLKQNLALFCTKNGDFSKVVRFPLKKWHGNSDASLLIQVSSIQVQKNPNESDTETEVTTGNALDSFSQVEQEAPQNEKKESNMPDCDYDKFGILLTIDFNIQKVLNELAKEQVDTIVLPLYSLADKTSTSQRLIELAIRTELESAEDPLADETYAAHLLSQLINDKGQTFIHDVLSNRIRQMIDSDPHFEVHSDKIFNKTEEEKYTVIRENCESLKRWTTLFCETIFTEKNALSFPLELKMISKYISDECKIRQLDVQKALGNWILKRLLVPRICFPDLHQLVDELPFKQKKNLKVLSQVLERIPTGTLFEHNDELSELNEIIEQFQDVCGKFMRDTRANDMEYSSFIVRQNSFAEKALTQKKISENPELVSDVDTIVTFIIDNKEKFCEIYDCTEEQLNKMIGDGIPIHLDKEQILLGEIASIRTELLARKQWQKSRTAIKELMQKYSNDHASYFSVNVLQCVLLNNRSIAYARKNDHTKTLKYAKSALNSLNTFEESEYRRRRQKLTFYMTTFNCHMILMSHCILNDDVAGAISHLKKVCEALKSGFLDSILIPEVKTSAILHALKYALREGDTDLKNDALDLWDLTTLDQELQQNIELLF